MVDSYPPAKDRHAFLCPPVGYSTPNHREIPQPKNRGQSFQYLYPQIFYPADERIRPGIWI